MFGKRKIMGNVALGSYYTLLQILLHVCIMFYYKGLLHPEGKLAGETPPKVCDVELKKLFCSNLVFMHLDNSIIFNVIHIL